MIQTNCIKMDTAVASTSREVPPEPLLQKAVKKRKSILERELETNMTAKMTSPLNAIGGNTVTSRFGRARKPKASSDFVRVEKVVTSPKKITQRKVSPPRSPNVFKMNASKSPVKIPALMVPSPSRSAVYSIDDLLNQNKSLSRFSTNVISPSKVGKVYVRRDLIQNRDEKTSSIMKNIFSPIKSPAKILNNSSHLNTILQRSPSVDVGSKMSPQHAEKRILSPQKSRDDKKTLSPRQASLIEHPSVIKTLNFTDDVSPKNPSRIEKMVSYSNKTETVIPPLIIYPEYEALEKTCTYQANDVAWARVGSYPFWPCLITRDPFSGRIVKEKAAGGRTTHKMKVMHVTFLADNGRRGWLKESMLRPFLGLQDFHACRDSFTPEQKKKDPKLYAAFFVSNKRLKVWDCAVQEGEMLLKMPSPSRIDVLYDMVYKPSKKTNDIMPLLPTKKNIKRVSTENRNMSLSESLLDTLFCEDINKVIEIDGSKKSLDVSDVVTACLDDMATKTGNIKIQKQSHMDRWLQKAKSKTPEKAVENCVSVAEKIRSRKNKRDIPSDDSDVSRTIQKLKKHRTSKKYLLRTDSSSGVDSEESKRNSLDDKLIEIRGSALLSNSNTNNSENIALPTGSSDLIRPSGQGSKNNDMIPIRASNSHDNATVTSDETNQCRWKSTPTLEDVSENSTEKDSLILKPTTVSPTARDSIEACGEIDVVIAENLKIADDINPYLQNDQSEMNLSNNEDMNITLRIDEGSSDVEMAEEILNPSVNIISHEISTTSHEKKDSINNKEKDDCGRRKILDFKGHTQEDTVITVAENVDHSVDCQETHETRLFALNTKECISSNVDDEKLENSNKIVIKVSDSTDPTKSIAGNLYSTNTSDKTEKSIRDPIEKCTVNLKNQLVKNKNDKFIDKPIGNHSESSICCDFENQSNHNEQRNSTDSAEFSQNTKNGVSKSVISAHITKESNVKTNNMIDSKTKTCVVFMKRLDLKPQCRVRKYVNKNLKLSCSKPAKNGLLKQSSTDEICEISSTKRELRKRKYETLNSSPDFSIVDETRLKSCKIIETTFADDSSEMKTNFILPTDITEGVTPKEPRKYSNSKHKNIVKSPQSRSPVADPSKIMQADMNMEIRAERTDTETECVTINKLTDKCVVLENFDSNEAYIPPRTNVSETGISMHDKFEDINSKESYDNPDFLLYVESKQDLIIDANPNLNQNKLMSHLHSLWVYEESKKTKEMKDMINRLEHDLSVKSQKNDETCDLHDLKEVSENAKVPKHRSSHNDTHESDDEKENPQTISQTEENYKLDPHLEKPQICVEKNSMDGHEQKVIKHTETEHTDSIYHNLAGHDQFVQNNSNVAVSHLCKPLIDGDSKIHENIKSVHNELETDLTPASNLRNIQYVDKVHEENKVFFEDSPVVISTNIVVQEISDQHVPKDTEAIPKSEDVNTTCDSVGESHEDPKHVLDVSTEIETSSLNSDLGADELQSIITPLPKSNLDDQFVSLQDLQADSSSSESESETESFKTKISDKYDDPNFAQYVETKRDSLMEEHPHLTEEEVLSYLYDMWSFSDSNKKDEVKNNETDEGRLVKGLGQETQSVPPKKNFKKRIRAPKEFDTSSEVFIPKDKPTRTKSIRNYFDHDTESDSEILEKPVKSVSHEEINASQSSHSKQNGEIDAVKQDVVHLEDTDLNNDQFITDLLKPKPNLFKGLPRERLCEICEIAGNLIKCRGHCGGMFHVECVMQQARPKLEATYKKKKKTGRPRKLTSDADQSFDTFKTNSLDSDGNNDEKPRENTSTDEGTEIKSLTIENADNFEFQLETKLKEILDSVKENDNSIYSSGDELDWDNTVVGQCEIIDVQPRLKSDKKPEDFLIHFKCNDCQKYEQPPCFICKSVLSPNQATEKRQKCSIFHCNMFYHLECLNPWPQTQFSSGDVSRSEDEQEMITCPRHVCHTCVCDDPRGCKTRFSGDKLARCVRCPAVYHSFTKCLPAGTKILNGSHIICPRHYEQKPGRVPYHVNTSWCFICALGGTLICCEYCPMSFHADCLNIQPPEDGYMCEDCETGRLPLYGELVWAKLGNYRWWPGVVLHPALVPDNVTQLRHSAGEFVVRFFGGNDHFWLYRGRVFPYQEGDTGKVSTQKSKIDTEFAVAVEQAQRTYNLLKGAPEDEVERREIAASLLPPHYVRLKVNRPHGSLAGAARRADPDEESAAAHCGCRPDDDEPCGVYTQCLNRVLLTECGPTCRAGERCHNRSFELRLYPKLAPRRTPQRGWGLHTLEDIKRGQFVIEYVGELIDDGEFRRRMRRMHETRDENYYFLTLDKERMIDAGPKGNAARFMNHSCEPNCETQKWTVLGDVRVGLFALRDIPAGSEVTFNYNLECASVDKKRCMCGAARCAGYIGAKPKQEEPKPKQPKRKYRKRARAPSPPPPPPGRKPRRSNTSLNAALKSPELTDIERDLLIIRHATRDLPSDTDSDGLSIAPTEPVTAEVYNGPITVNNGRMETNGEKMEDSSNRITVSSKKMNGNDGDTSLNSDAINLNDDEIKLNEHEIKVNGDEVKVNGDEVNHGDELKVISSEVKGKEDEITVNSNVKVNGDEVKVNGDELKVISSEVNGKEDKINVNNDKAKVNGNPKREKVLRVALERSDRKKEGKGKVSPSKRKRVSFSSEEVVICYDSGTPQEKRPRLEPPKGYEAAFQTFPKKDEIVSRASDSKD